MRLFRDCILVLVMLFFYYSCGSSDSGMGLERPSDNLKPVARAYIKVTTGNQTNAFLNVLLPVAYASGVTTTINYVAAESASLDLNISNLVPSMNGDTLEIGSFDIDDLKVNKLKICGINGNQKCTRGVIIAYTTDVLGFPGIEGFVNTTDAYGVPITHNDNEIGLGVLNNTTLQEVVIPANKNVLHESDFNQTFEFQSDFTNGGFGNYELNLVIEVALGL